MIGSAGREGGWRAWIAVAAIAVSLAAPRPGVAATRFGVDLGVNLSRLDYDQGQAWWTGEGWRAALGGGATMEVPLGRRLGLATGFRYVRMGSRVEFDKLEYPRQAGAFTIAQDYFAVPLLLTVRSFRPHAWSLSLGPELGVLVAAALDFERTVYFSGGEVRYGDVVDLRDELEPVVLMGTVAVGWEIPRGALDWCVQARTTFGLTRAAREFYWSSDWRTVGIETTAGLRW